MNVVYRLWPLLFFPIDMLSGFFIDTAGTSYQISVIYKGIFIILCLFVLISNDIKEQSLLVGCIILVIVFYSFAYAVFNGFDSLIIQLPETVKLFAIFLIISSMWTLKDASIGVLDKFNFYTLLFLFFNVVIGVFGYGFNTYDDSGFKGYIYAGNSLSAILALLTTHYLVFMYRDGLIKYILTAFFFLAISFLIGTKSGILSVVIISIFVFLYDAKLKVIIRFLTFSMLFLLVLFLFGDFFLQSALYARSLYIYQEYGLVGLILSGRNEFFNSVSKEFFDSGLSTILLGLYKYGVNSLEHDVVEMDWIDLLFSYGFIIYAVYFMCFVFYVLFCIRNTNGLYRKEIIISGVMLIIISFIAGHVIFNGVLVPYWGVSIGLLLIKSYQQKESV
ncbi:O-antigen ligase family protein [Vibrio cholerae]|uniref:O-antigen ligase family protein n=3 Tax=Vibrio cholerae TaxID=666 RepID=UPI00115934C4|nr:O-antigen ligase family protein [Vibrio cholerae]TQP54522.1 hypothetical protein FLL95_18315 [Vibrio cholerae]TQP61196.1 hypothetical protein FLL81_07605 [Vibrio cholerae]